MVFSVDCVSIQMTPIKYYITILPKFQVHLLLKITKNEIFPQLWLFLCRKPFVMRTSFGAREAVQMFFEIPFIMHLCVVITLMPSFKQLFIVLCETGQYVIYRCAVSHLSPCKFSKTVVVRITCLEAQKSVRKSASSSESKAINCNTC